MRWHAPPREEPEPDIEYGVSADPDFVLASCLEDYAIALIVRGEVVRAVPFIMESLEIYRQCGNQYAIAACLGTLGRRGTVAGRSCAGPHGYLHEAVTIATVFKHHDMLGHWQPLLGIVTLYSGDVPEARRLLTESLRVLH